MKPSVSPAGGYTDIRDDGWLRRLPPKLRPYALLARLDRPIGVWLLFLPGLWSILLGRQPFWFSLYLITLFGIGAVVMRSAGCVVNDLWDRKLDRMVVRTANRPLASGAISPVEAMVFLALLLLVGLGILLSLDIEAQRLGIASLALVALYPLAKRVTWWPQVMLGFTFGWGAPMGYAAATHSLDGPVLPLYAASILWILGYDTIYAHQDREDDALVGIRSTARLFGNRTRQFLTACYGGMMIFLVISFAWAGIDPLGMIALAVPAMLLAWQIIRLDIDNPGLCLALFKLNQLVGLLIGLSILIGRA